MLGGGTGGAIHSITTDILMHGFLAIVVGLDYWIFGFDGGCLNNVFDYHDIASQLARYGAR